jgi:hypothetical protein
MATANTGTHHQHHQEGAGLALSHVATGPKASVALDENAQPGSIPRPGTIRRSPTEILFNWSIKVIYVGKGTQPKPCVQAKVKIDDSQSAINQISRSFLHHTLDTPGWHYEKVPVTWSLLKNDAGIPAVVDCLVADVTDFHLILTPDEFKKGLSRRNTWRNPKLCKLSQSVDVNSH